MAVVEFEAMKKWARLSKDIQERFLRNVFCPTCGVTMIVEYSITNDDDGILLNGSCKKCGRNVARMVEIED